MARQFICEKDYPVVETKAGKLRGFVVDGTFTFHGIKYADAKRFHLPTEVEHWDGIKDALAYGYVSPMLNQDNPTNELMVPHRYWPLDENCQYLNVWTQTLDKDAKKPVLVWLHGGGFAAGSSIEQVCYEGDNMSREGDCVVVTINHRLNILGYMDLSPYGEEYKNSGNAGNADMVAALQWVHDNIAGFGGDPENVTIFGQSGGGMKVTCLLQTPAADGLFHRGIVMSGVAGGNFGGAPKGDGKKIVEAMIAELGLPEGDVKSLEKVPYDRMAEAYKKVAPALAAEGWYVGGNPIADDYYLGDPLTVGFREHALTVPVMVGSVMCEFAFGPGIDKKNTTEEEKVKLIYEKYGERSGELIDLYKKAYPGMDLADLLFVDSMFRAPTEQYAEKKAAAGGAPTYSYMFAYEFPIEGGKRAWHCSDLPFVFHNTCRVPICSKPGVSDRLEDQMFGAWMNFARYGNPNHPGIPQWDACSEGHVVTMMFDEKCTVRDNFDKDFLVLLSEIAPKFTFGSVKVEH